MKNVLFVDDEPNILRGLKRLMRPYREQFSSEFSEGGEQALSMLASGNFDIMVTDMKMPGMSGEQLLEKVAAAHPAIARIILSGHADHSAMLRSVGVAHQALAKPCNPDQLVRVIKQVCRLRDELDNPVIREKLTGLGSLPSIPEVIRQVRNEVRKEETSVPKVAELIGQDPAMTTRILALVNSAFFGLPRSVDNIAQATTFLGLTVISDLALASSAFVVFEDSADAVRTAAIWQKSVAIGAVTKSVGKFMELSRVQQGEASQAALLLEIGRLALACQCREQYQAVMELVRQGMPLLKAEQQVLKLTHPVVGAYLLGLWGLPDSVVGAVAQHHNCEIDDPNPVSRAVIAAVAIKKFEDEHHDYDQLVESLSNIAAPSEIDRWLELAKTA